MGAPALRGPDTPIASTYAAGRAQLCPGQRTTLTAAVTGSAATSYHWSTGVTTGESHRGWLEVVR